MLFLKVSATPLVNMFGLLQTRIRSIKENEFSVRYQLCHVVNN